MLLHLYIEVLLFLLSAFSPRRPPWGQGYSLVTSVSSYAYLNHGGNPFADLILLYYPPLVQFLFRHFWFMVECSLSVTFNTNPFKNRKYAL